MVGFTLLSRSYYYLRRRSPGPPFPPDHRQAGKRGAISEYWSVSVRTILFLFPHFGHRTSPASFARVFRATLSNHPSPTPTFQQVSWTLLADGRGRRRRRDTRR